MRKIIMIAAVLGFAATAYAADLPPNAPPPAMKQPIPGAVTAVPPNVPPAYISPDRVKIIFAGKKMIRGVCYLDIQFTIDGKRVHTMGNLTAGNVGDLFLPNPYSPIPDNSQPVGTFVEAGSLQDQAIFVEVQNPIYPYYSVLAIFYETQNQSGLAASSLKMFVTDGNALNRWNGDIRSAGMDSTTLTFRWEQAPTVDQFFAYLSSKEGPRDRFARPNKCERDCGQDRGGALPIPGGVVVPGAAVAVPGALVAPNPYYNRLNDQSIVVPGQGVYGPRY